jgi:TATA-binding protein-associated factor
MNRTQRIGAAFAIESTCQFFGEALPQAIPTLWEFMFDILAQINENHMKTLIQSKIEPEETNKVLSSLQLLEVASPFLHEELYTQLFGALSKLCLLIQHPFKAVRHMASRCLATVASINAKEVMGLVIRDLIPLLGQIESSINREGAIEAITCY